MLHCIARRWEIPTHLSETLVSRHFPSSQFFFLPQDLTRITYSEPKGHLPLFSTVIDGIGFVSTVLIPAFSFKPFRYLTIVHYIGAYT